jgi:hypothetical protein
MVQSTEVYQLLEYTPLFDNLLFESFINRHYTSKQLPKSDSYEKKNDANSPQSKPGPGHSSGQGSLHLSGIDTFDANYSEEESEMDFGGADFGLYGFDEESRHVKAKPKVQRPEIKKLALRFMHSHEGINYLEVEKYLEAVVSLLREVRFDEFPELVAVEDFTIMNKDQGVEEREGNENEEEERSHDYREINRQRMQQTDFQIKDNLNDLMENASLTNILMGLNEIQNKFISQDKSKLNFLNMLIYSVDFSELMSLLYEYSIRLLKDEIEEEEQNPKFKEASIVSGENNKTDILVFLVMKLQFKILFGLAELRLFELFYRELNLKFDDIKSLKMEKLRMEIKEQLAMYFSKSTDEEFSTTLMLRRGEIEAKRTVYVKKEDKLSKLEELVNNPQTNEDSIIMLDKTQSEIEFMNQEHEFADNEGDPNRSQEDRESGNFKDNHEDDEHMDYAEEQKHQEIINPKRLNNLNENTPLFSRSNTKEDYEGMTTKSKDNTPNTDHRIQNASRSDENSSIERLNKIRSRSLSNGDSSSLKETNLTFQQLKKGFTIASSKDRSQNLEKNFSFKNDLSNHFINKVADNADSIRRARENIDELISIRQIINETNTNFSISETSDHTLLNMLNIPFGVKNIVKSQIKSKTGPAEMGIKAHIKSKSNHWGFDIKKIREIETDLKGMLKVDSKGKFNVDYLADFKKQHARDVKQNEIDSKISSIMFEKQMNNSKSFFSQDKQSNEAPIENIQELELEVKNVESQQENSNKSQSLLKSNDMDSQDNTVPHMRPSIPKSENNRATSKKEILIPIQKFHEERPTHKYRDVDPQNDKMLKIKRVSIDPAHDPKPIMENFQIGCNYIPEEEIVEFFRKNYKVDRITFNEIGIHWTNFQENLKELENEFGEARLEGVEGERQKKKFESKLRKFRSKVDGLKCNVMKVHKKYIAFFDPKFYSIIKDFCDVDYMRKQVNLLMNNGKFELLGTKDKVQNVRFTKPVYMYQLKLSEHPIFL